jgi:anaerobic magnesium-protoporphyrin IX monomethyl ester cyclase
MAMKVLLVQHPIEDFYDTSIRTYPLGLLYVGARAADIADVSLLDGRTGRRHILAGHKFPELDPFYMDRVSTPLSFFSRYSRYGMSRDEMGTAISRAAPDLVGIASLCSAYEKQAQEVAKIAKKIDPDVITVMGGTHPTLFPGHVLRDRNVDYCIRGEGETPFFKLLSALTEGDVGKLSKIEGLCFRTDSGTHISEVNIEADIDLLPKRDLVNADAYRINKRRYAFFLTSRGCPLSCGFCGKPPVPYRKRGLSSIEKELDDCRSLGIEAIDFEDDMLNLDRQFFAEILGIIGGRGFTLSAMNGIYPGNMDIPTLQAMDEAGFRRLNFSLVDTSAQVLQGQLRKEQRSFIELLPFLESSPFLVEVHFIIGLPGQEPSSLIGTLLFLMEKRLLLGPSIFYLSPGSSLCPTDKDGGPETPFETMRSSFMLPFNPLFPRPVTFTFVKLVRFINYVKQLIDRQEGITRMSDMIDNQGVSMDERGTVIIERLVREKRLVWYDAKSQLFVDEPVEQALIRVFFDRARGRQIRGYRSSRSLLVDV